MFEVFTFTHHQRRVVFSVVVNPMTLHCPVSVSTLLNISDRRIRFESRAAVGTMPEYGGMFVVRHQNRWED